MCQCICISYIFSTPFSRLYASVLSFICWPEGTNRSVSWMEYRLLPPIFPRISVHPRAIVEWHARNAHWESDEWWAIEALHRNERVINSLDLGLESMNQASNPRSRDRENLCGSSDLFSLSSSPAAKLFHHYSSEAFARSFVSQVCVSERERDALR